MADVAAGLADALRGARVAAAVVDARGPRQSAARSLAKRFGGTAWSHGPHGEVSAAAGLRVWRHGGLVRALADDPTLARTRLVVVDHFEARSVEADLLVALLRKLVLRREDLRLAVLAASEAAAETALACFKRRGFPPAVLVDLRAPVRSRRAAAVLYRNVPCRDAAAECAEVLAALHTSESPGFGGLVAFLPNADAVARCAALLRLKGSGLNVRTWTGGPRELRVGPPPAGERNCVLIGPLLEAPQASLSLALHSVGAVVDTVLTQRDLFDVKRAAAATAVVPVTRREADRRAALAAYKVVRLCTEADFGRLPEALPPEMQRADLARCVLQLTALGVEDLAHFDFVAPPPPEALLAALDSLHALGAVDDAGRLTQPHGERMAALLPLEPVLAKLVLESLRHGCSEEALSVAAAVSVLNEDGARTLLAGAREQTAVSLGAFASAEGDPFLYVNAWRAWEAAQSRRQQDKLAGLSSRVLRRVGALRSALRERLRGWAAEDGVALASCCEDAEALQRCLCAAFFANAARLERGGRAYVRVRDGLRVQLHPDSTLARFGAPPAWVVAPFAGLELRHVARVRPSWLLELAAHVFSDPASVAARREWAAREALAQQRRAERAALAARYGDEVRTGEAGHGGGGGGGGGGGETPENKAEQEEQGDDKLAFLADVAF